MYDTSPLPFKGETKSFLHVDLDNKTLESLFDLHPSFENSFDLTDFVVPAGPAAAVPATQANGNNSSPVPTGVPDSSVVTSPVASSSADLLTLSSAATSQHLAEIERNQSSAGVGISTTTATTTTCNNNNHNININSISSSSHFVPHHQQQQQHQQQIHSPVGVVPSTPSPVSPHGHHHHQHQLQQQQHNHNQQNNFQGYPPAPALSPALSPALTVDDVFSDDSCVFMPEYEQLTPMPPTSRASSSGWGLGQEGSGAAGFFTTVKTEDLGLPACSLEASLPGFTSGTTTTTAPMDIGGCKMEYGEAGPSSGGGGGLYGVVSPSRSSMRSMSESSTETNASTIPEDSPRRLSKGGSKRRQVPKGSEEYKEKRARNNVAVRKSRAKAKQKQKSTEGRVKELMDKNDSLSKKVEMLTKELTVLRGLFVNVGASLPDDFAKLLEQS